MQKFKNKLSDFPHIIIQYLYTDDQLVPYINYSTGTPIAEIKIIPGERIGVVVAVAVGILGWSLCSVKDKFDRELALKIAIGRANKAAYLDEEDLRDYYDDSLPIELEDLALLVNSRSVKYFKEEL